MSISLLASLNVIFGQEDAVAERYGVQIRVIGDLSLLPEAVQRSARDAMERTKHHKSVVLNICLAYS